MFEHEQKPLRIRWWILLLALLAGLVGAGLILYGSSQIMDAWIKIMSSP